MTETSEHEQAHPCRVCGEVGKETWPWDPNPEVAAFDPNTAWICNECAEDMAEPCDTCGEDVLPFGHGAFSSNNDGGGPWVCGECAVRCDGCEALTSPSVATAVDGDNDAPWLCPVCTAVA